MVPGGEFQHGRTTATVFAILANPRYTGHLVYGRIRTRTGQPISPPTGYGFDGLDRNTSLQIDPSGNIWITNNWTENPQGLSNPGGHQMVVYLGVAGAPAHPAHRAANAAFLADSRGCLG